MKSITSILTEVVSGAFHSCNYDKEYGTVVFSKTNFCQFQCNGSLMAAKKHKCSPLKIAHEIQSKLSQNSIFNITVVNPGFINIDLTDEYLAGYSLEMLNSHKLGYQEVEKPLTVIIDYGGPNIAKPLHVGHLRSAIIGESIKTTARFIGHRAIGDIHLGDWGLQMGMVIAMLKRDSPQLAYFFEHNMTDSIANYPIYIEDLEAIYPEASALSKIDKPFLNECRLVTFELQKGDVNYKALWHSIVNASISDLKDNYLKLNVTFDIWKGESDSQEFIAPMVEDLLSRGFAYQSHGAIVVDVSSPTDSSEIPPLILYKSDGASLYSTTDLATIVQRKIEFNPDNILYVVDKRQSVHFQQVFRCAYKSEIAPKNLQLEFIPFGTMNGKDGKPFKTREGGVMKLSILIDTLIHEAKKRLESVKTSNIGSENEQLSIAKSIGIAALKFGDLISSRESDYIFDLDKFISFEGKTGPYVLYSAVRIKSILLKAQKLDIHMSGKIKPTSQIERDLLVKILEIHDVITSSFEKRLPSIIAEYVYSLSNLYNSFYHGSHVLNETNLEAQSSLLAIISLSLKSMETCLDLLGISIPDRM